MGIKNISVTKCKNVLSFLVLLVMFFGGEKSFSQISQKHRKSSPQIMFSTGAVIHNSAVVNQLSEIDYKFNYDFHISASYLKLWKFRPELVLGHYSKRYHRNIIISNQFDESDFDFSNQSFPVFYTGIGLSLYKDIPLYKNISFNLATDFYLSATRHSVPDIAQITTIPTTKHILLYNYLISGRVELNYNYSESLQFGVHCVFQKECFHNLYKKIFFPYKYNIYGIYAPTNFLAMPEFPNFSLSPQLSVKYFFKSKL